MPQATKITLKNLASERSERCLFSGLTLEIAPGSLVRIVGENGAGKTTLMRIIAGLLTPTQGQVLFDEAPRAKLAERSDQPILYLGHLAGVKDELSALENLVVNATISGLEITETKALDALDSVGLTAFAHARAQTLSAGQKRRIALARLYLSREVPIWLLDEPFTALDVKSVARLSCLIDEHAQTGGTVIFITHQDVAFAHQQATNLMIEAFRGEGSLNHG